MSALSLNDPLAQMALQGSHRQALFDTELKHSFFGFFAVFCILGSAGSKVWPCSQQQKSLQAFRVFRYTNVPTSSTYSHGFGSLILTQGRSTDGWPTDFF